MKKVFVCFLLVGVYAISAASQIEVPVAVEKSFQKKYPKNTEASWDDLGDSFEVTFYDEGEVIKEATFETDGTWRETISSLDEEELSLVIKKYLNENYDEYEVYEIFFSEKPDEKSFYVTIEISGADDEDEESETESITLVFDKDGKFLTKE